MANKIKRILSFIITLPFTLMALLGLALSAITIMPFINLMRKRDYKKSSYYKDFKFKFNKATFFSESYNYYNNVKEHDKAKFVHQESNGFEYLIHENTIYLFREFSQFATFNEESRKWELITYKRKKEIARKSIQEFIDEKRLLLDKAVSELPVKVIVERDTIANDSLDFIEIPENLFIVLTYSTAFNNIDWNIISNVIYSTKALYEQLLKIPNLCGEFELIEEDGQEILKWRYNDLILECVFERDISLLVAVNEKVNRHLGTIEYSHNYLEEIYQITSKGSVIVAKHSSIDGDQIVYTGTKENCPFLKEDIKDNSKIEYFEIV